MGITSLRAWILAASLLSVSAVAHAAGLGKLNVTSALGEPLKAEIELFAEKSEVGSLAARLAKPEAFERAGLAYSAVLADIKVSVEKRANGESYVRVTSTQPLNEPFLDLLVELSWSSGRISREFTALLDPPFLIAERERQQKAAEAQVRAAPPAPQPQPEPMPAPEAATAQTPAPAPEALTAAPAAPVETVGGPMPTLLEEKAGAPSAPADAYGPVRSGDTLGRIARATKSAEVSLDQMLVLLFRNNPDAFAGRNMNRLKTGKIIQLPSPDQYATISAAEARKEVQVQARDWNAYREQLAMAVGQAAPAEAPAQQAAAGKVTATVADKATAKEQPKEVLKLSKSEPATGAATSGAAAGDARAAQDKVRSLEEELVARDKAVKEASDRVAKLESTIKDLQALLEIKNKGMVDLQKPAAPPAAPPVPPAAKPAAAVPAGPAPGAQPATPTEPAAPVPEPKTQPAPTPTPAPAPTPAQPAPAKPRPAARPVPAPVPEPSLLDQALGQPAYLAAGVGVLLLIGALAARAVKRRRKSKSDDEESGPARAAARTSAAPSAAAAFSSTDTDVAGMRVATDMTEEVDPVAEAEIFLAYGRDAQAEELLKEALAAAPGRYEIHLKLLQIYAKRKDVQSFERVAREMQQGTGGSGDLWDQAVKLGYQVNPANPRYAAGAGAAGVAVAAEAASAADNVDFNIGLEDAAATTATDIDLGDSGSQFEKTQIIDPGGFRPPQETAAERGAAPSMMDFNVDLPLAETAAEPAAPEPSQSGGLDFDLDLNSLASSAAPAAVEPAAPASGGLDFDMSGLSLDLPPGEPRVTAAGGAAPEFDLSGISLDLGAETSPQVSPTGKNDHWYDVQTKFDLAKAYQEMGDKDGARDILKEVLQEGDAEQKAAAQAVLASLEA